MRVSGWTPRLRLQFWLGVTLIFAPLLLVLCACAGVDPGAPSGYKIDTYGTWSVYCDGKTYVWKGTPGTIRDRTELCQVWEMTKLP